MAETCGPRMSMADLGNAASAAVTERTAWRIEPSWDDAVAANACPGARIWISTLSWAGAAAPVS